MNRLRGQRGDERRPIGDDVVLVVLRELQVTSYQLRRSGASLQLVACSL